MFEFPTSDTVSVAYYITYDFRGFAHTLNKLKVCHPRSSETGDDSDFQGT